MPLTDTYPMGVVFIGRRTGKTRRVAGTGFFVSIRAPLVDHHYIVTAAHVVEGAESTFVRLRTTSGARDLDIAEWVPHGTHDVAVAPIVLPDDHAVASTTIEQFIDAEGVLAPPWWPIELGDTVYFVGLLGKVRAMTERNIPIVRHGVLGAMWQDDLPVKRSPVDRTSYITAHLIDCRSFGGFSGAPCYLQKTRVAVSMGTLLQTETRTLLLGLIGGHFDDWMGTRTRQVLADCVAEEDEPEDTYSISDDVKAPVSTGVGYVIPAEFIRETLMKEELREMRDADHREAERNAQREDEENAGTMDTAEVDTEYERFEDLTRKLVNTPKPKSEPENNS